MNARNHFFKLRPGSLNSLIAILSGLIVAAIFPADSFAQGRLGGIRSSVRTVSSSQTASNPNKDHDHADAGEVVHEDHAHDGGREVSHDRNRRVEDHRNKGGLIASIRNHANHPVHDQVFLSANVSSRSHGSHLHAAPQYFGPGHACPVTSRTTIVHSYPHAAPVCAEPIEFGCAADSARFPGTTYFDRGVCEPTFADWCTRLNVSYGNDFEGLAQGGFSCLLQSPGSLGIDTSVTMLRERGVDWRDHLWIGDVNLVYELVANTDLRARMGIGINWLGDRYGGEAGLNLTSGLDWRISERWNSSAEIDLGSLADADLFHGRITLSRKLSGGTEWTTGYDYYDIGGSEIGSVITGLTFRF